MADAKELPELVTEFVGMSKEYLQQETVGRAKALGRFAGFSLGAAVAGAVGALLLAVAGVRLIIEVMPGGTDHRMWSGLAYVAASLALMAVMGIIVGLGSR